MVTAGLHSSSNVSNCASGGRPRQVAALCACLSTFPRRAGKPLFRDRYQPGHNAGKVQVGGTMAADVSPAQYKDVVLFLATAGVVAPLLRRWKISPILGFLAAGVILGPFGLGALAEQAPWLTFVTIDNPEEIRQLAELGVVFLMFMVGLEISWERLRLMRRQVFLMGGLQVAISFAVFSLAAYWLGQPIPAAVAIGAALSLSSTAMVVPILTDRNRLHSASGRAAFAILLFQDLAVAPMLITLSIVGRREAELFSPRLLLAFAPAALGLIGLIFLGRLVLRPMMKSVAKAKSEELFMATSLLIVIGAGLLSAMAGLSMALGAFVAGVLLAETEYRRGLEVTIEPFKGLLLGLFFVSIGIGLNLAVLVERPQLVLGIAAAVILVNGVVVLALTRLFRLPWRTAAETALLLAGGGEFAFVLLDTAIGSRIVRPGIGQAVLVGVTLSMFVIPLLAWLGARVGRRGAKPETTAPAPDPTRPRVLVVGYGRVGKLIGGMLTRHDIEWLAAERDPRLIDEGRRDGKEIVFGDASRTEFLVRCGLETAKALVVTMDSPEGAEAVVASARALRPDLVIVARARDARHARRLYELGATDAVPETIEASLQLSEALLVDIGIPMGLVIASIHERRDEFRAFLNRPEALGGRTRRARNALDRA
jgi:monovalent cation:H+ antiporter-2, CPA2 family